MLGRAAQLAKGPREVLRLAAIAPRQIELALVAAVLAPATEDIEACVLGGLLLAEGRTLRFRHELARTAVEESILPPRAMELHGRVLAALAARPPEAVPLAQVAHHAHVTLDREKTFCVYDGPSPESIRKVAERNKLPVDRITEVSVLDPYFYRG